MRRIHKPCPAFFFHPMLYRQATTMPRRQFWAQGRRYWRHGRRVRVTRQQWQAQHAPTPRLRLRYAPMGAYCPAWCPWL